MDTAARILIVDDDPVLCETLSDLLDANGLEGIVAHDGAAMTQALTTDGPELLLLDLRLKREDGLTLARQVRAVSDIPIVIMTGQGDEMDVILGLELVADDYLTKPFHPRELVARLRAVLRRARSAAPKTPHASKAPHAAEARGPVHSPKLIHFGGYTLNLNSRQLLQADGVQRRLTANEFNLLEVLALNVGRPLSRDELLEGMRRHDSDILDRAIDVLVMRLRRKVEPNPSAPRYIRTARGHGYVFSVPEDDAD